MLRAGGAIARSLFAKERKAAWVVGECVWKNKKKVKRKQRVRKSASLLWGGLFGSCFKMGGKKKEKKKMKK